VVVAQSPDPFMPIDEVVESSPDMDFQAHIRTFNAVVGAAKWFIGHVFILLIALYFFAIANQPVIGTFGIVCSIALLIFGLLRRPSIRADISKAAGVTPGAPGRAYLDARPSEEDRTA
jgi:hypothetical protein